MNRKAEIGRLGEDLALKYLIANGYKIIERNYRRKWGEIDIIALSANKILVFVEVKTIRVDERLKQRGDYFIPEYNLSKAKLGKVRRTASIYANNHPLLINDKRGWRVDLMAMELDSTGGYQVRHYENV